MSYHHSIDEAKRLLNSLGITPIYFVTSDGAISRQLSDAQWRLGFGDGTEGMLAWTAPIADLLYQSCLRYEWAGRGCCIVLRRHPINFTTTELLGLAIHEAGHFIAWCDRPDRDDSDSERALKTFWANAQTKSQHHDRRWLRATTHLWHRACRMGHEIPFTNVLTLEQYGYGRADLTPLLSEASRRESEPIEAILRGDSAPAAAPSQRVPRGSRFPYQTMIHGEVVTLHANGSIDVPPKLDGGGRERFASVEQFRKARNSKARTA
ncbi:MAG: hypothetical protein AB7G28_25120 [Pirellulales bacterium]